MRGLSTKMAYFRNFWCKTSSNRLIWWKKWGELKFGRKSFSHFSQFLAENGWVWGWYRSQWCSIFQVAIKIWWFSLKWGVWQLSPTYCSRLARVVWNFARVFSVFSPECRKTADGWLILNQFSNFWFFPGPRLITFRKTTVRHLSDDIDSYRTPLHLDKIGWTSVMNEICWMCWICWEKVAVVESSL